MSVYVPKIVAKCRTLYAAAPIVRFATTKDMIEAHSEILYAGHQQRNDAVVAPINNWHPGLIGKDAETVFEFEFGINDARLAISRECGYESWDDAVARSEPIDVHFENAVDLALDGDLSGLHASLSDQPQLLNQTSSFGHRATILIYMGSNGVEFWRQVVPDNICDIVKLLVDLGADPTDQANVYGGQFDVLALAESSAHPTAAGVRDQLLALLTSFTK